MQEVYRAAGAELERRAQADAGTEAAGRAAGGARGGSTPAPYERFPIPGYRIVAGHGNGLFSRLQSKRFASSVATAVALAPRKRRICTAPTSRNTVAAASRGNGRARTAMLPAPNACHRQPSRAVRNATNPRRVRQANATNTIERPRAKRKQRQHEPVPLHRPAPTTPR